MIRWVIIHKPEEDARDWGFSDNRKQYGRSIVDNTVIALMAPSALATHDLRELDVKAMEVVVFSRGRYENLPHLDQTAMDVWLRPLADGNNHVWVHFGGKPAESMTSDEVERRWRTELEAWHPFVGATPMIRPYSVMSENSSDDTLRAVRAELKRLKDGFNAREQIAAIIERLTQLWVETKQASDSRLQWEDLMSCLNAHVAFQQFLIAAEASEAEDDPQDQLQRRLAAGQADAMHIAWSLKAELERDDARRERTRNWLLLLEAIVRSETDPRSAMRRFCEMFAMLSARPTTDFTGVARSSR